MDKQTENISIIGVFTGFRVVSFAQPMPAFFVFVQLIDGIGRYDITVELEDFQNQAIIAKSEKIAVEFKDRPNRTNMIIPVPPLLLKHPGSYDLVVCADTNEIDRQQFIASPA